VKDGILTLTLVNDRYDEEREFRFNLPGADVCGELWTSEEVTPYTDFTRMPLAVSVEGGEASLVLPPHSAAKVTAKRI